MKKLLSIGQVSKLKKVSIQALRLYDRMGIIVPKVVHAQTGYRFYSVNQLFYLDILLFAKKIGIPLKEIKKVFDDEGPNAFLQLLQMEKTNIKDKITELQSNLDDIAVVESQYYKAKNLKDTDGVYYKDIEERDVITAKIAEGADDDSVMLLFDKLYNKAEKINVTLLHEDGYFCFYDGAEMCREYVYSKVEGGAPPVVKHFDGGSHLCINYHYLGREEACKAVAEYMRQNELLPVYIIEEELIYNTLNLDKTAYELQIKLQ